jgi:hypothetical protein
MRLKLLVLSAASGAAAAYFFDPQLGRQRRDTLRSTFASGYTAGAQELRLTAEQARETMNEATAPPREGIGTSREPAIAAHV